MEALSSFGADLPSLRCKNLWLLPMCGRRMLQSSTCGCSAEPGSAHHAASILGPSLTLLSPDSVPLTSVGLHLLRAGLELGSGSALSIGLDVMVSSGLSSGWTKEPFQSCGEQGRTRWWRGRVRDGSLSPGRECSEMLKMAFWGIIFPSPLSMKNEGCGGRPVPRVNASALLLPSLPLSS